MLILKQSNLSSNIEDVREKTKMSVIMSDNSNVRNKSKMSAIMSEIPLNKILVEQNFLDIKKSLHNRISYIGET
jgi:Tat protein secretion system quality control protein TatD with DNase activity